MPFYFIQENDLVGETIHVGLPLAHHLIQVLRCRKGDSLTLVDAERTAYTVRIIALSPKALECEILSRSPPSLQKKPLLHLGMALIKGDKMDWAIQKAVELGVDRISPLITRRVVAKLAQRQKRWIEIAKEAAQQSERREIPTIDTPSPLASFLEETRLTDMKFIFWENAPPISISPQIKASLEKSPESAALLIGPEGGWEKEEVDQAIEKGYIAVSLGERPVRAETAALAAITIIQYEIDHEHFRNRPDNT